MFDKVRKRIEDTKNTGMEIIQKLSELIKKLIEQNEDIKRILKNIEYDINYIKRRE